MNTDYLSPKHAAARLQLSEKTLEKWRSLGVGPKFHKFGSRVRYSALELDAWAKANVHSSTSR